MIVFSGAKEGDFCKSIFTSDTEFLSSMEYVKTKGLETIEKLPYTSKVNGRVGKLYDTPGPGKITDYKELEDLDFGTIADMVSKGSIIVIHIKLTAEFYFYDPTVEITRRPHDTFNYGVVPLLVNHLLKLHNIDTF